MNPVGLVGGILISMLVVAIILPETTYAGCTCDAWCRGRGHRGGVCGDGHTCLCDGKRRPRSVEESVDIIEYKVEPKIEDIFDADNKTIVQTK